MIVRDHVTCIPILIITPTIPHMLSVPVTHCTPHELVQPPSPKRTHQSRRELLERLQVRTWQPLLVEVDVPLALERSLAFS